MSLNNNFVSVIILFSTEGILDPFTFDVNKGSTVSDVCQSLADYYDLDVDDVVSAFTGYNGADLSEASEAYFKRVLNGEVYADDELCFDGELAQQIAEYVENDDDDDYDYEDDDDIEETPVAGLVLVRTGGGINTVTVDITSGVTTVADVIASDKVLRSSGMTLDNLKAGVKTVNGNVISSWEACNVIKLKDGDTLDVSPQAAHCKGNL